MAKFIFDTNALLYVIAAKNYHRLDANCHILDLAFYEYGNAVLNILSRRARGISKDEAALFMQSFREVAKFMPIIRLECEAMQPVLELAKKERLTFYDASYLYCSQRFKYALVTGDRKLLSAAKRAGVDAIETARWAGTAHP
ncbi:MAG TPA: type II toxin-antitoxin system VapC family toxin [Nitrososphaera sp.]|jgi:predicted nucleic acid-binding protein